MPLRPERLGSAGLLVSLALVSVVCSSSGDDGESSGDGDGDTDGDLACGDHWGDDKDPEAPNLQETWGSPCASDSDCEAILGADAFCVQEILSTYELPGGYCSRHCTLPDNETIYVFDDPVCDPAGGVDCIGVRNAFEACAVPCESDVDCHREGYACTRMPDISNPGDQTYCLMEPTACCLDLDYCGPDVG
jgi:hypothetical protein